MCALCEQASDTIENFVCQFYLLLNITVGLFAIFHMSINVYLMKLLHSKPLQVLIPSTLWPWSGSGCMRIYLYVCLFVCVLFYSMWLAAAIVYSLLLRTQAFAPPAHSCVII